MRRDRVRFKEVQGPLFLRSSTCFVFLLFVCLPVLFPTRVVAQNNLGFESGLKGWTVLGENVSIDKHHAYIGKAAVRITGHGSVAMRMNATPLSLVQYNFYISSERAGVAAYPFIRFYDSSDALLLEYRSRVLSFTNWQPTGNYTETPPAASWLEIGLETDTSKTASTGILYADNFSIESNPGAPVTKNSPTCNIDAYLHPFWLSDTIYDETVLLYSSRNLPANGKLLFTPDKILSVKSFDGKTYFNAQTDFNPDQNSLIRSGNSPIPFTADTFFNTRKNFAWYNLQSKWIRVTYTHKDTLEEPMPSYKADKMPNTLAKLRAGSPVNFVVFGTEIGRGMNSSGFDGVPPFMPSYPELFAGQLRKQFRNNAIHLYNASFPGSQVDWAAAYADKYVNPLKPDLVILDFGIHDCWKFTPDDFRDYIATIIRKVRTGNPGAEFLLVTDMLYDPEYVLDGNERKSWWRSNMRGYGKALQGLESEGIVGLDMTALSEVIYRRKKARDCLSTPLNPNDYMSRWYAQAMSALFVQP